MVPQWLISRKNDLCEIISHFFHTVQCGKIISGLSESPVEEETAKLRRKTKTKRENQQILREIKVDKY